MLKSFLDHRRDVQQTVQQLEESIIRLRRLEEEYLKQEEALHVISEYANDWEYWQDASGAYLYVSPSCEQVTGYTPEDFYGDAGLLNRIIVPEHWERWEQHSHNRRHDGLVEPIEFQILSKNGEHRWIHHICRKVTGKDGGDLGIRGSNRDITQLKELQDKLAHVAGHDHLTGLPNRSLFLEHLRQGIKDGLRNNTMFVIAFIDLDGFKEINDRYGHDAGDLVLKKLADTFTALIRQNDIISRFGGDEFVAFFEVQGEADTDRIKEKIMAKIPERIHCSTYDIYIRYSIGISLFPHDGTTMDELLKRADADMYAKKAANKARYLATTASGAVPAKEPAS